MIQLGEHFGKSCIYPQNKWGQQRRWFIRAKQARQRREELEDQLQDDIAAFATSVVLATPQQLKTFEAKLDSYDEATIKALMLNQEQLDEVTERLQNHLNNAHVMEDGRRVFKTKDGQQVFDEFGSELSNEIIDPAQIGPNKTLWEDYKRDKDSENILRHQRQDILKFQEKADAAREQISKEGLTETELKDIEAELEAAMPDTVKQQMEGHEVSHLQTNLKGEFQSPASPIIQQASKISFSSGLQI